MNRIVSELPPLPNYVAIGLTHYKAGYAPKPENIGVSLSKAASLYLALHLPISFSMRCALIFSFLLMSLCYASAQTLCLRLPSDSSSRRTPLPYTNVGNCHPP